MQARPAGVRHTNKRVGMILKGFPRISESFISTEILLLESLGIPIEIYSLRQPREHFAHDHVSRIKASTTYLPEYVLPNWKPLFQSNTFLWKKLGNHYNRCLFKAMIRAGERRKVATLRHFLQAGHLAALRLTNGSVTHLHAHFCHTPTSVALFASDLTGLPFSFTAHAKDIYISEPDQLIRKIQHASFVVTCTEYNARYLKNLAQDAGCTTPIHIVYHGINLDFFSFNPPAAPSAPPYRILSIGRLVPKKGYDTLLEALKILDHSGIDFQFCHIGSGELERQIQALVSQLKLDHRVEMLGTLPHHEVLNHYRKSHCFVLASKLAANGDRDGIPNVLIEAMATGVPVVSTNVSAIPELIENGVTGTLVPPDNPSALAGAIAGTLLYPESNQNRILRAREKVEKLFDNKTCIKRLHALLKSALENS